MARFDKQTQKYDPGYIYELRCCIQGGWHPFYVGETCDLSGRAAGHRSSANNDDRLVYQFIREVLEPNNIEWNLFPVIKYGAEGPTDQEDEHIMTLLYDGVRLKNMKKGNANWLAERERDAKGMRERGIRSYRQYREIISLEEQTRRQEQKHQRWMCERVIEKIEALERSLHYKKYTKKNTMSEWDLGRLQSYRRMLIDRKRQRRRDEREYRAANPNFRSLMTLAELRTLVSMEEKKQQAEREKIQKILDNIRNQQQKGQP